MARKVSHRVISTSCPQPGTACPDKDSALPSNLSFPFKCHPAPNFRLALACDRLEIAKPTCPFRVPSLSGNEPVQPASAILDLPRQNTCRTQAFHPTSASSHQPNIFFSGKKHHQPFARSIPSPSTAGILLAIDVSSLSLGQQSLPSWSGLRSSGPTSLLWVHGLPPSNPFFWASGFQQTSLLRISVSFDRYDEDE